MEEKDRLKKKPETESNEPLQRAAELKQFKAKYSQMKKILEETQSRYEALFNSTFSCVYVHDLEGRFIDANKTALKLLGYAKKEIPSLNISSLLKEDALPSAFETVEEIKKTGYLKNPMIYKVRKKNGDYIWMEVIGTLIYQEGKPYAIQGIAQDITERKQTEEALRKSEEQYRTMIETMNEGLSVVDQKGIITFVNNQFCSMIGYRREELLGSHETVLLDEDNQKILRKHWPARTKGGAAPYELALKKKDGKKVHTLVAPRPVFDERGQFRGSFGIFTDITALKQIQEELLFYQDRLRSLALELSLVEEKERRHIIMDLQDHIGQSLGYCRKKLIELKEFTFVNDIKDSLNEIQDVIEQTIRHTKSLKFELSTPILYERGLEDALKWLGEHIQKEHGIVFLFDDDQKPKPMDDETRILLYKSVRELLINVIKHAHAQNIKVSIHRDYKHILINVSDDGIGFDTFKTDAYISKKGVFGLFSISERLKYLDGQFKVESAPAHGAHFTLIAPLRPHIKSRSRVDRHENSFGS
jgi:PAS domain S-box-containing protein